MRDSYKEVGERRRLEGWESEVSMLEEMTQAGRGSTLGGLA